jgi:hypothetical protein
MRHSPARRSLLSQLGRSVRLADQIRDQPRHTGSVALGGRRPHPYRAFRLAAAVAGALAGFGAVLALIALVVRLSGAGA